LLIEKTSSISLTRFLHAKQCPTSIEKPASRFGRVLFTRKPAPTSRETLWYLFRTIPHGTQDFEGRSTPNLRQPWLLARWAASAASELRDRAVCGPRRSECRMAAWGANGLSARADKGVSRVTLPLPEYRPFSIRRRETMIGGGSGRTGCGDEGERALTLQAANPGSEPRSGRRRRLLSRGEPVARPRKRSMAAREAHGTRGALPKAMRPSNRCATAGRSNHGCDRRTAGCAVTAARWKDGHRRLKPGFGEIFRAVTG